jgi:hypothetical protein
VSALLYVLRLLAGRTMPLNSGCLRAVDLVIPPGTLLSPGPGRAVAAGNVETSQRVVDVLLGALGLAAASQGTMNNLTFGDSTFGYYETLAGGAGACAGHAGAQRRAHAHDEHADHRSGAARGALSGAAVALRDCGAARAARARGRAATAWCASSSSCDRWSWRSSRSGACERPSGSRAAPPGRAAETCSTTSPSPDGRP